MGETTRFFVTIGVLTVIVIVYFIFVFLYCEIATLIDIKRREYRRKHKFDKTPTAKCYCVDCKYWKKKDGRDYCIYFDRETADCFFCSMADPYA